MKLTRRLSGRRWSWVLVAAMVFSLLAAGCGSSSSSNNGDDGLKPEELIPAGSNLIGDIHLTELLDNELLKSVFESLPFDSDDPQSVDDLLDRAALETGVDFRAFTYGIFFGDTARLDDGEYFGLIAEGTFDQRALLLAIERAGKTKILIETYKEHTLHIPEADPDSAVLTFLSENVLVLGSPSAVRAVIDVHEGDLERTSGDVYGRTRCRYRSGLRPDRGRRPR